MWTRCRIGAHFKDLGLNLTVGHLNSSRFLCDGEFANSRKLTRRVLGSADGQVRVSSIVKPQHVICLSAVATRGYVPSGHLVNCASSFTALDAHHTTLTLCLRTVVCSLDLVRTESRRSGRKRVRNAGFTFLACDL